MLCAVAVPASGQQRRVMGMGEPREPQPFTREQRLLEAARQGDQAVVERALDLGVSVEARDDLGRSALLLAVRDAGDLSLVRFLHQHGAGVDEPDLDGRTPLSFAASAGRLDLVEYLAAEGARLDLPDKRGRTPLFHAVLGDEEAVAKWLLEHGAAVDVRDHFQDTPLLVACAKGYGKLALLLREHGADPGVRDQEGRSLSERSATGVEACLPPEPT